MKNLSTEDKKKQFEEYVNQVTPKHSLPVNMGRAFLVGGSICTLGQLILKIGTEQFEIGRAHV